MPAVARTNRLSPWGRLVATCGALVGTFVVVLVAGGLMSREQRLTTYTVHGQLNGVTLDLGDADVVVAGGGARPVVGVERRDRVRWAHDADAERAVTDGVLRLSSRCPHAVPRSCSSAYRVTVPDNLPLDVRTTSGSVRVRGFRGSARLATRSGDIDVSGFCGFMLQARSESGDVAAAATCAVQQLTAQSTDGFVHVLVPPGRYQVDAESASGVAAVRGVALVDQAPFAVQATSSTGDVLVESA